MPIFRSHWVYNDEPYDPAYEDIDAAGFVYMIHNTKNGMKYVGRKRFHKKRRLKPLKGKKRGRIQITESDWREYTGSSIELNDDIKKYGKEYFVFEIISFHVNFTELNYHELKLQFDLNVLESRNENGERIFYNRNFVRRYYPSDLHWEDRLALHEQYRSISP